MKQKLLDEIKSGSQNQNLADKDIYSFREALVILDLKASTLYKKTHKRTIRFFKPNGKIYFLKQDLINYMLSNEQKAIEDFEKDNDNYLNRGSHE